MQKRLRQADPRWSKLTLGFGPGTIGKFGCALVSICQAAKLLRGVELLPPHLNAMGREAKGFKEVLVIWDIVGRAAGLEIRPMITGDGLYKAIATVLKSKGACLLHVDHKNDERGDHWVLAHSMDDNGNLICSCSAIGGDVVIDQKTMTGPVMWGKEAKTYSVRGARPVFPVT